MYTAYIHNTNEGRKGRQAGREGRKETGKEEGRGGRTRGREGMNEKGIN